VSEVAPGLRLEHGDHLRGFRDLLDRHGELARQPVEAPALEHRQMIADNSGGKRIFREAQLAQLYEEALGEVARGDAGRVELLDATEDAPHDVDVRPRVGEESDLLGLDGEISVLVEAPDDDRADLL